MFFCSVVFCNGPQEGQGLRIGLPVALRGCHGAEVRAEVRRVWGVRGVVPMAAGRMGPRAFTASCSFALLSFERASEGQKLRIGLLVALGKCHGAEVRVSG